MEKIEGMLPTLKMLKIAEYKNDFAVHFPTLEGYIHFMRGTWPEVALKVMWAKYGADTGVYVLDVTEKEGTPPNRTVAPITLLKNIGLRIVPPDYVYNYVDSLLAKFKRGDRVIYTKTLRDFTPNTVEIPTVIVGLKAENIDGLWHYEILVPGAEKTTQVSEARLSLNEDHPANKPETDFINKDAGQVRKPAGPKTPVDNAETDTKAPSVQS